MGVLVLMARRRGGEHEKENCDFKGKRVMAMMWFNTSREAFVRWAGGQVLHERKHL